MRSGSSRIRCLGTRPARSARIRGADVGHDDLQGLRRRTSDGQWWRSQAWASSLSEVLCRGRAGPSGRGATLMAQVGVNKEGGSDPADDPHDKQESAP
jgi:hypothetical protein